MKISDTYSASDLATVFAIANRLMRVPSIQEAVDIVIDEAPPVNRREYAEANEVLLNTVLSSQPHVFDRDMHPHQSYEIVRLTVPPLVLLFNWVRLGILEMALENYINGISSGLALQATACQFGDDSLLLSGAVLGFGIWSLALRKRERPQYVREVAAECESLVHGNHRIASAFGRGVLDSCGQLYTIAQLIATMIDPSTREASRMIKALANVYSPYPDSADLRRGIKLILDGYSEAFDNGTESVLAIRNWVDQVMRHLGLYAN